VVKTFREAITFHGLCPTAKKPQLLMPYEIAVFCGSPGLR
jgi:hypothetical protein